MNKQNFSLVENPRIRIPTIDAGRLSHNKTSMIGFLEVDITDLRRKIMELRRQNISFSLIKKTLVVQNEVQIREVLNMTVIFDHNIIDGTPARNFMNTLVGNMEKGIIEI